MNVKCWNIILVSVFLKLCDFYFHPFFWSRSRPQGHDTFCDKNIKKDTDQQLNTGKNLS